VRSETRRAASFDAALLASAKVVTQGPTTTDPVLLFSFVTSGPMARPSYPLEGDVGAVDGHIVVVGS